MPKKYFKKRAYFTVKTAIPTISVFNFHKLIDEQTIVKCRVLYSDPKQPSLRLRKSVRGLMMLRGLVSTKFVQIFEEACSFFLFPTKSHFLKAHGHEQQRLSN